MNYIEVYIPAASEEQAEIWMAWLDEMPFESFDAGRGYLKGYIRADDLESCRTEVEEILRGAGDGWTMTEIEQQNWNGLWESNFEPVDVDGRVMIRAPFHGEPAGTEVDVIIMPKMSFGTGHHATTWLMAASLMDLDVEGRWGLDMGSGTGVLAILAAKRGAAHVDAVDIDQWAYENCWENMEVNGVADMIEPILGDISAICGRTYDFILANINRNILLADMEEYALALRPGGVLIMSGIFEGDIPSICDCATSAGLEVTGHRLKEGWAAVMCENV